MAPCPSCKDGEKSQEGGRFWRVKLWRPPRLTAHLSVHSLSSLWVPPRIRLSEDWKMGPPSVRASAKSLFVMIILRGNREIASADNLKKRKEKKKFRREREQVVKLRVEGGKWLQGLKR